MYVMAIFLYVGTVLSYLAGLYMFSIAKSAIHEILAVAFFINGTVALIGGAITQKLDALYKIIDEPGTPKRNAPPPRRENRPKDSGRRRDPNFD